jgi:hypothetical protein
MMSAAAYFQQNPDVAAAFAQNNYGLTPEQFAQTHFERFGQFEQRTSPQAAPMMPAPLPAAPTMAPPPRPIVPTPTPTAAPAMQISPAAQTYFQQNPDVVAAYQANNYGLTPDQFAQTHFERFGQAEQRVAPPGLTPAPTAAPTAAPTRAPGPVPTAAPTRAPGLLTDATPADPQLPRYFQQNPDVAAAYAQNNYGMTPDQFAEAHFLNFGRNEQRSTPSTIPFANATQGFQQQLNDYTSIPIGAQYNPAVVGGTGSPYSQIMSQMQPVGNPYATVRAGLAMGGYDPSIYDPNLFSNFVQQRADQAAADAAAATAQQTAMDYGGFNGGLITKVMGPNPSTPDDGTMFVQKGEYIVKKDAVNKYGKGLLDQINDGKIPAKKMKSLLG